MRSIPQVNRITALILQNRWLSLLAILAVVSCAKAHDELEVSKVNRGRAVLSKIETFQSSVKQKLKTVLMGDQQHDETDAAFRPTPRSSRYHDIHAASTRNSHPAAHSRVEPSIRPAQFQSQADSQRAGHQWVAARNDVDPIQYREMLEPDTNFDSSPLPPSDYGSGIPAPLRPISRIPAPNAAPSDLSGAYPVDSLNDSIPYGSASSARSAPFDQGPAIAGTRLGQSQVTATERALALMRENEILRASRNNMATDNARLRETLKTTQDLLARSDKAMQAAQIELQNADVTNKRLREKVVELESKHKRALMETDRMLNSLREELDEVLVNEISDRRR